MATLLSDEIAEKLELKIRMMEVGEKLPSERMMAEEFGVSRNMLRESLHVLRDKGIIDILPGKGAYVSNKQEARLAEYMEKLLFDNSDNQLDVMEVRQLIETEICLKAVDTATENDIQELERIYSLMEESRMNAKKFKEYDMEFHLKLARASHNRIYAPLVTALFNISDRKMFQTADMCSAQIDSAQEEHFAIIRAIKNRDSKIIRQVVLNHCNA